MSDLAALVVQQSLNGVYLGCLYVMVALGLTLIYGVLNQINFAHADFVTVGAFAAFFTATHCRCTCRCPVCRPRSWAQARTSCTGT